MTRTQRIILATVLLVLAGAHGALATISPSGIDARLRLDWEVSQARHGRPEIQGYVINDYMQPAMNVRLLVETLDGNGQAIDRTYSFVLSPVPALSRAPFVVPLKAAGARYRISITAFTWKDGGSAAEPRLKPRQAGGSLRRVALVALALTPRQKWNPPLLAGYAAGPFPSQIAS